MPTCFSTFEIPSLPSLVCILQSVAAPDASFIYIFCVILHFSIDLIVVPLPMQYNNEYVLSKFVETVRHDVRAFDVSQRD